MFYSLQIATLESICDFLYFLQSLNKKFIYRLSLNDVFTSIESSKHLHIQREARDPHRIIQKHIILDEIPQLLEKLEEWIKDDETATHFKRFSAHLVLFLEQIGQAYRKDVEPVVEAYVMFTLMISHIFDFGKLLKSSIDKD